MKRILSFLVLLSLVVMSVASCTPADTGDKEKEYSLGIGVSMAFEDTSAKVTSTVAAVVTDKDGKIVLCRIDAIDSQAKLTADGEPNTTAPTSKYELGDSYNMVNYGGAIAEWYKQAEFFETYVEGKTLSDVEAIALGKDGKPTGTDLTAGCTIAVNDFVKAIANAIESEHKLTFTAKGELTAAVSVNAAITADKETLVYKTAFDYAAVVSEGASVVGALVDSAETTLTCEKDDNNKVTATAHNYVGTKLEQGDDYNMVEHGGAISEWYAQATAFAKTAIGKEAAKLDTLPTEDIAGCTIGVTAYKAVLVKAGKAAR